MLSFCRDFDEDACPISDDVLAKLFRANEDTSIAALLDAIEPEIKPRLAFFCYRRAHLQTVGLAIAARCDESELVSFGGRAGTVLFERSRQVRDFVPTRPAYPSTRKITPPTGFLCRHPFEQEADDRSGGETEFPSTGLLASC
jgi:hypothetical protein